MPEPLFRYSDQPRDIIDATLWGYGTKGRPIAMQKIEYYQKPRVDLHWFYCTSSLSERLIETRWQDGQQWVAKVPGIELKLLPNGPAPSDHGFARLVQMKRIARRFSATIYDPPLDLLEHMRLLPRPIDRYSDPDAGLRDGALFGFATNGTNPDLLLVVELHEQESGEAVWKYGLARMTTGQLNVHFDDKEVWSVPYLKPAGVGNVSKFDTWLFFWESPEVGAN